MLRGFAPSAESAKVLGDAIGIEGDTVASLIHASKTDSTTNPEVWIIDEAGLLSAKDAHSLLQRATKQQARLLFVGDTRQLSSVKAGNPFKSLQAAGMLTARLDESLRQKTEELKLAVDAIARGDIGSSFHHPYQSNSIQPVQNQVERQQRIVDDYLALPPQQRAKTLMIANTNAERLAITQGIREGLQSEGALSNDTFTLISLKPRDLTTSEAKYAKNYVQGDVLIPIQDYRKQELVKGEQYEVIELEPEINQLTLRSSDGKQFSIDPAQCDRKTVYEPHQVPLAVGDQLRWTRNDRTRNRRNGQQFTIDAVDEFGQAIVRYDARTTEFVDLHNRQTADYAVVQTTYSSQGKSADRVLVALDGSTGKESFYVAASRARHQLSIYTTDEAQLRKLAERSRANENASDYLDLFTYQPHRRSHAQNKAQPTETNDRGLAATSTSHSANRAISTGNRASERLAATLQRDRPVEKRDHRNETSTSPLEQCLEDLQRVPSVSRDEIDAIADKIADFVERRAIVRNGAAITNALESIAANLQQLERVSQQLAERDRGSDQRVELTPEQEQQWQWAEAIFPAALDLMRRQSEVADWRYEVSPTQTRIYSPHYTGIWDSDRQALTYFRNRDGKRLFSAHKQSEDDWALEQPENINAIDVSYHNAIGVQRSRGMSQNTPASRVSEGPEIE